MVQKKPLINPPNYFIFFVILILLVHIFLPIYSLVQDPFKLFGAILILLGIYLNLFVHLEYRKTKNPLETIILPKVFILKGPFKLTRNPLYLGMLFILIGEGILLGSLTSIILSGVFSVFFFLSTDKYVISIEEKNMQKKFGKEYLKYKKDVRRWI